MIPRPLHLEPGPAPPGAAAAAWCIPGNEAEKWLHEITPSLTGESAAAATLYIMPASPVSRAAAGLFIIPGPGQAQGARLAGLPFRRVGRALFVPLASRLLPDITAAEADALPPPGGILVLHPSLGAVGFEETDAMSLGHLLIPLPERNEEWSSPLPGPAPLPRLRAVVVRPPLLDDLFGAGAKDIGSDPPKALDHPSSPPRPGMAGPFSRPFLRLARALVNRLPRAASRPTLWDSLDTWLRERLGETSGGLQDNRHRAIDDLLRELRDNPDEGLKHALPLSSAMQHRGTAPPSSRLGTRTPNFDLNRLGGGRAADPWDVPPHQQQELRRQYMELANREIQAGRHRRAAYIYAELLGDLGTAAVVLKNGGHYAEAALLFRDHLHRPLEAADCFVLGGQFEEAITLYEAGPHWDKLAALHRDLGDESRMRAACEAWVAALLQAEDLLQAARVLHQHLDDRDRALHVLENAWPASRTAAACVEKAFDLRGSAGEHKEAARLLEHLLLASQPAHLHALLGVFSSLQHTYPDRGVKALAEDLGRREIARLLPNAPDGQRTHLARLLESLCPGDQLLARDARRHVDEQRQATRERVPRPKSNNLPKTTRAGKIEIKLKQRAPLPWSMETTPVIAATASQNRCFLASYKHSQASLHLLCASFSGSFKPRITEWMLPVAVWAAAPLPLLAAAPQGTHTLLHLPVAPDALPMLPLPREDVPAELQHLGTPAWLPGPVWAAAYDGSGHLWTLRLTSAGWRLSQFSLSGVLVHDTILECLDDLPMPEHPLPMCVTSTHVVLAAGARMVMLSVTSAGQPETGEILFDSPVSAMVPSPPWGAPRVAAVAGNEVQVVWLGGHRGRAMKVAECLETPQVTFSSSGALHLLSGSRGTVILATHDGKVEPRCFDLPGPASFLLPTADLWSFATVEPTGHLAVWEYDGRHLQT